MIIAMRAKNYFMTDLLQIVIFFFLDCFVPRNDNATHRHCETPMKASSKRKMTKEKKCHSERSEESLRLAYLLLRCDSSLRSE